MTVQFILPEATSFPKERKLHDRLFLVLLYNLLCKTFKDHSSTFATSLRSERNSLLQERCFPIASAKVGHFSIPCKTSTKKNARKIHLHPFCYFIAWQNRQLSPFFRFIPSLSFSPQNRPFSSNSATFGAKTTFCEVFFSSPCEKFSPKISVFAEKISLTRCFCLEFAPTSTFAGEEKEEEVIFHPLKQTNRDENGHISLKKGERERKYKGECDETRTEQKKKNRPRKKNEGKMPKIPERKIKMGKVVLKQDSRDRKTQSHHGKAKGQNQKASVLHRKDQAQPSKTNCFSSPPPLRSKNTSRLSLQTSPLFATSSLVSLKTSLPRTNSPSLLRAGHAPTRIYALAHSPNLPFLPSPFTSPRNKL